MKSNNWNAWAEHCATEFCSLRAFPNENAREHAWSGYFNGFREGRKQARVLIEQLEVTIARLAAKESRPAEKPGDRVWLKENMRKYVRPDEPGWEEYVRVRSEDGK